MPGHHDVKGFLKMVAPEAELLIPDYTLSIDYYNHAVRINLTEQAGLAVKASSWFRDLGRQIPTGSLPANWRDAGSPTVRCQRVTSVPKEGPYQDRPLLYPFHPSLPWSCSSPGSASQKNSKNRSFTQIPSSTEHNPNPNPLCGLPFHTPVVSRWRACTRIAPKRKALKLAYEHK